MVATFHNHTTFCDGKNTPREVVEYAYENGFRAIGLSGHATTPYDLRYCMKDIDGYIKEVNRLKEEYKGLTKKFFKREISFGEYFKLRDLYSKNLERIPEIKKSLDERVN